MNSFDWHRKIFDERGYVLLPNLFRRQEVTNVLHAAFGYRDGRHGFNKVVREKSGEVRSIFFERGDCMVVDQLLCSARLIPLIRYILNGNIYPYQIKLNSKSASGNDIWPWHQDFIFWHVKDGVRKPSLLTAALFLSDISFENGPLLFIKGSHKAGLLPLADYTRSNNDGYQDDLSANLTFRLNGKALDRLLSSNALLPITGDLGTVVLFDSNLVHGSERNHTLTDRNLLFLTYNRTNNVPRLSQNLDRNSEDVRPNFLANRNASPILYLTD